MKKYWALFMFIFVLLLAGCAPTEELVHIATAAEMQSYVSETYGNSHLVRAEEIENGRAYHFKNLTYNFEYVVTSTIQPIQLENTVFGYKEVKESNFMEGYRKSIWGMIRTESIPDCVMLTYCNVPSDVFSPILGYVVVPNKLYTDEAATALASVGRQLVAMDYRGFLSSYMVVIKDRYGNDIGYFAMEDQKVILTEHSNRSFLSFEAKEFLDSEDLVMYLSERMWFEDVPGLSDMQLENDINTEEHIVTIYHFTHNFKRYFIADIKVTHEGQSWFYVYNTTDGQPVYLA